MVLLHAAVLDGVVLRAKVAHAREQVHHGDLVIVVLIVKLEAESFLLRGIAGNEVIDRLAILVIGALLGEVEELDDDVGEADRVALHEELLDLRPGELELVSARLHARVMLNDFSVDFAKLRLAAPDLRWPLFAWKTLLESL